VHLLHSFPLRCPCPPPGHCCSTCRRRAAATAPLSLSYSVACLSLPTVISFSYLSLQQSRKERIETRNESGHVLTSGQLPLPKGTPKAAFHWCCTAATAVTAASTPPATALPEVGCIPQHIWSAEIKEGPHLSKVVLQRMARSTEQGRQMRRQSQPQPVRQAAGAGQPARQAEQGSGAQVAATLGQAAMLQQYR
jgi:hypothetical protein